MINCNVVAVASDFIADCIVVALARLSFGRKPDFTTTRFGLPPDRGSG